MKRRLFLLAAILLVIGVAAAPRLLPLQEQISRYVIGSAGEVSSDTHFIMNGTLGEPIAGAFHLDPGAGAGHSAGFWYAPPRARYLPFINRE